MNIKKKKIAIAILACFAIVITAAAGYCYGVGKHQNELSMVDNDKQLPVYEDTTLYAAYTFPELINKANSIVITEVVEIGETYQDVSEWERREFEQYQREHPEEDITAIWPLVTPVTVKVNTVVKGMDAEEMVYYANGGTWSEYIMRPSGYEMKKGMEVILFLSQRGYALGGGGEAKGYFCWTTTR